MREREKEIQEYERETKRDKWRPKHLANSISI